MNTMMRHSSGRNRRGVALILAISLLALFTVLGTLYIRHMNIELDRAGLLLDQVRARNLAGAGVHAAIADLQRALPPRQLVQMLDKPRTYTFATYKGVHEAQGLTLASMENRKAVATVTISDESGKINLNHAPASVLQAILGVDGATARAITSSLPRTGGKPEGGAPPQWLLSTDDLVTRGLLTPDQFARVNPAWVTTYTVTDHADPAGFLNVNAAPADVMAAILDLPLEAAQKVMQRRPFNSLQGLGVAAEKDPATFNFKPDPSDPAALPAALSFESRCFRIVSEAVFATVQEKQEHTRATAKVDAIVVFTPDGGYEIVRWNTQRDT